MQRTSRSARNITRQQRPVNSHPLSLTLSPAAGARGQGVAIPYLAQRDGSTLLIVMVLLGLLSLIGFLFYTFAAQERSNSTYFADSYHYPGSPTLDPDTLFNWSLQQLIVGPNDTLTHSALAGRRQSMLPNMFGKDIHPYNSAGVRLGSNAGQPFVDANQDGVADATGLGQQPLDFNDSAAANGGTSIRNLTNWPDPGVDYTYPDINNLFLAYKGFAIDANGNTVQVIIPSFHRPQLLRQGGGVISNTWYQDSSLAGRIMRPHPSHLNPDGNPRFPSAVTGTLTSVFPFGPDVANPNRGQQGIWSLNAGYVYGTTTVPAFQLDVDNDGDLIKEGVWMDLHYPVQTDSTGKKFVPLFSFTVYDADALLNLNVHGNHGRIDLATMSKLSDIPSLTKFLSSSNQGNTPSEVNPLYALNSDPNLGPDFSGTAADLSNALKQYQYQFGTAPTNYGQLANMEWYRILTGTANFQSATGFNDVYSGRYGESGSVLISALNQGISNGSVSQSLLKSMPWPGVSLSDDNWNKYEGEIAAEANSGMPGFQQLSQFVLRFTPNPPSVPTFFPTQITYYAPYPYGQPMDFTGRGTIVKPGTNGKTRLTVTPTNYRLPYPQYSQYDNPGGVTTYLAAGTSDTTNLNSVAAGYHPDQPALGGLQMVDASGNPYLPVSAMYPTTPVNQVDEDAEIVVEPKNLSTSDSIYAFDEMGWLHTSATDRTNTGVSSRLQKLAPFNFQDSNRANQIAQRFTTASWDRKQFGYACAGVSTNSGNYRPWEFTSNTTFPPTFGGIAAYSATDPFRAPVRKLLDMTVGDQNPNNEYQFRLSLNHLTTTDTATNTPHLTSSDPSELTGKLIQRALTPHDPNLAKTPASLASSPQEVRARLDRQQMARDIYVMLYTLGGGVDFQNQNAWDNAAIGAAGYTGDNTSFRLFTARQLREMAQYAVNIVDAQDPDHVMTKFEYDKNLGDGWNLNDYAYDNDGFTPYATGDVNYNSDYPEDSDGRGVVYGVEAQQLTLNEVLAFQSPRLDSPPGSNTWKDHAATRHDDAASGDTYYSYVEIKSVSPADIDLSNRAWRIRIKTDSANGSERFLIPTAGLVRPEGFLLVKNAGREDANIPTELTNIQATETVAPGSNFKADPDNADSMGAGATFPNKIELAPWYNSTPGIPAQQATTEIDVLMDYNTNKYILHDTGLNDLTNSARGGLLNRTTIDPTPNAAINADTLKVTIVLERRQYPDRPFPTLAIQPENDDNPWVAVDKFQLNAGEFVKFKLDFSQNSTTVLQKFQELKSRERIEPFQRQILEAGQAPSATPTDSAYLNSLKVENYNLPGTPSFTTWQWVLDRPFASPIELFHIPVYGPNNVTKWQTEATKSPLTQTTDMDAAYAAATTPGTQSEVPFAATGAGKILQAEYINNQNGTLAPKEPARDNRWYRLFEFFEVPTRMHRQLGNPLSFFRQPGKIAINTIRHPDVFAGLLDDTDVLTFANAQSNRPTLYANDATDVDGNMPANLRDWWVQFLKARDGRLVATSATTVDKQADNVTGLFLPGLADSSPFRGLGTLGFVQSTTRQSPNDALESTIFRKLPFDLNNVSGDPRHLWEVGSTTDHTGTGVDSEMKHRLLSKIFNNTTTRSHVFLVYVSVQPFEADDSAGAQNVRIGGVLKDSNGNPEFNYRSFFVIDRSQPEDAYVFDPNTNTGNFSNYQALVKYRLRLN